MNQYERLRACAKREPDEVYHANATNYVGSHALATFRDSPRLFANQWKGLTAKPDHSVFAFGRAFHTMILEGEDVFGERYTVGGPVNPKTGNEYGTDTKAYAEWRAEQAKDCISTNDYAMLLLMRMGVQRNHALPLGIAAYEPTIEHVWRAEIEGVPVQAKIDYLDNQATILDLKSCRSIRAFPEDAAAYGYAHQLAFYGMVLHACLGGDPFEFSPWLVACEKQDPYRAKGFVVPDEVIRQCVAENREALQRMRQCMDADEWPDHYDSNCVMLTM